MRSLRELRRAALSSGGGAASVGGVSVGAASAAHASNRQSDDSRLRRPRLKPLPHQKSVRALTQYIWVLALGLSFLLAACSVLGRELLPGFESQDATLFHDAGVVHRIDYGAQTALIGGLQYRFAANARVHVNGTRGAWSMLLPQMKVDFIYLDDGPSRRTIVELYQLPPQAEIEGY